jgi:mannose-1-phosphate guanylyltransferase
MAGGRGTRLQPVTDTVPKPFVPIAGTPCIEYVLEGLADAGIADVIATTHYRPWQIIERLRGGGRYDLRIFYSLEDEALGTAGGVRKTAPLLDDTFVVASGDVLADVDVGALVDFHRDRDAVATMALTEVPWEGVSEYGVVATDEGGRIERFQEKPKQDEAFSNLVNAGIYVLEPEAIHEVPEATKFDFSKQLFPKLLEAGEPLYARAIDGLWMDVGRPEDLLQASIVMAERRHGGAYREGATVHGEATVRRSNLYQGSRVERGALVEESIVYRDASVGRNAVVRSSIVCEEAEVGEDATVEDGVVGAGARVPEGATLEDERVDPRPDALRTV